MKHWRWKISVEVSARTEDLKTGANKELEKILVEWFQHMRADNVSIDGPELHAKAIEIALRLNTDNFKASNRWLHRFKQRHDITYRNGFGESEVSVKTMSITGQIKPCLISFKGIKAETFSMLMRQNSSTQ
jgi:hypothetical protein